MEPPWSRAPGPGVLCCPPCTMDRCDTQNITDNIIKILFTKVIVEKTRVKFNGKVFIFEDGEEEALLR